MTKPKTSQEIIDYIRRLLSADPENLNTEEKKEREFLVHREQSFSSQLDRLEPKFEPGTPLFECYQKFKRKIQYADYYGLPITLNQWSLSRELGDPNIEKDRINGYRISTVWLGLNHGWGDCLQIFETMIFEDTENGDCAFDTYQERYSTLEEAREGHQRACKFVREKTECKKP